MSIWNKCKPKSIWKRILEHKEPKKLETEKEYWARRQREYLADKVLVTRYVVFFGTGHYRDFCGVKELEGYYDKTYPADIRHDDPKWEKTRDMFYIIAPDDSGSDYWGFDVDRVFETREAAQTYYNFQVINYTKPLQTRIDALEAGIQIDGRKSHDSI